jgi:hypothetical protein
MALARFPKSLTDLNLTFSAGSATCVVGDPAIVVAVRDEKSIHAESIIFTHSGIFTAWAVAELARVDLGSSRC